MIIYKTISGSFYDEEIGKYESFGILANKIVKGEEILIDSLVDISTDEGLVDRICSYCNERRISPFLVLGVVEDFIG